MRCNCAQYVPAFLIPGSRCLDCGRLPLRQCDIWCGDVLLTVQACDTTYANIGIFQGDRSVYFPVHLPSLQRQYKPRGFSWDELPSALLDTVMAEYRADILALIGRLNASVSK